MQTLSADKRSSHTWRISAHFSPSAHLMIYDSSLQYSQAYIRDLLTSRLDRMQRTENTMNSITLLSFAYPRQFRPHAEVPVIVILHFSVSIGFPAIQALLGRGTIGINATCTPVDYGEGEPCPDVTLHPTFATFRNMSSKDMGPSDASEPSVPYSESVDPNLWIRVDVFGNSDAQQATIAAHETQSRTWTFEATFAPSIHTAIVTACDKVAANCIQAMMNMDVVNGLGFFSFACHPKDPTSEVMVRCL